MGDSITKVLLAITTISLLATLVVNGTNSAKVISSAGGVFTSGLGTAEKG
jgi:hypothetical protein